MHHRLRPLKDHVNFSLSPLARIGKRASCHNPNCSRAAVEFGSARFLRVWKKIEINGPSASMPPKNGETS